MCATQFSLERQLSVAMFPLKSEGLTRAWFETSLFSFFGYAPNFLGPGSLESFIFSVMPSPVLLSSGVVPGRF